MWFVIRDYLDFMHKAAFGAGWTAFMVWGAYVTVQAFLRSYHRS